MGISMQPESPEYPVATPEMFVLLAMFEVARDHRGTEWCRKHGVGGVRKKLGVALPPNVIEMPAAQVPRVAAYIAASKTAQSLLLSHCRECRGCKLGRD